VQTVNIPKVSIYHFSLQLTFEEDLQISEMHSGEGETVPFTEKLYPTGNVEDWLCEVERVMKGSLREILSQALDAYVDVSCKFLLYVNPMACIPTLRSCSL